MGSEEGGMLRAVASLDDMDDNILSEILLRLPPEPSSLPRSSAVSKRWHSLACNPAFCRRFRRHHRRNPPLLGFLERNDFLSFVPTLDVPDRVQPGRFSLRSDGNLYVPCGCRHGLVAILNEDEEYGHILVWDPITGDQKHIFTPSEYKDGTIFRGAVLRDSGDVHFRVVLVGSHKEDEQVLARVYSSETSLWSDLVSIPHPPGSSSIISNQPAVLVGDSLYWEFQGSFTGILEFNLESLSLAVILMPMVKGCYSSSVVREEGGGLCVLLVSDFIAELWKMEANHDGLAVWALGRTIELDKLLSLNPYEHDHIFIKGYAEENNVVFLSTVIGLFMVQLQSLKFTFMKHSEITNLYPCHPFESVYTAETRSNGPDEFDLSIQYIR